MTELIGAEIKDIKFWKDHLQKAREFSGSDVKYCEHAGIKLGTFTTYKKRLGFTKGTEPRNHNAFVKVESAPPAETDLCDQVHREKVTDHAQQSRLPDAKWLAEFILNLASDA
jgi:hypothetical protein